MGHNVDNTLNSSGKVGNEESMPSDIALSSPSSRSHPNVAQLTSTPSQTKNVTDLPVGCTSSYYSILIMNIMNKDWNGALDRCVSHPSEISQWVVTISQKSGAILTKKLPIHFACKANASTDLLFHLIDHYPSSIAEEDNKGSLPISLMFKLHYSKEPEKFDKIASYLLTNHPSFRDCFTKAFPSKISPHLTPNHTTVQSPDDILLEEPKRGDSKITEIQHQCKISSSSTQYSILIMNIMNKDWNGALDRCVSHPSEISQWVVTISQKSGAILTKKLPIHFACKANASTDLLFHLIDHYPSSIAEEDNKGSLPISLMFKLHYSKEPEKFDKIASYLLTNHPSFRDCFTKAFPLSFIEKNQISITDVKRKCDIKSGLNQSESETCKSKMLPTRSSTDDANNTNELSEISGYSRLCSALLDRDWELAETICNEYPDQVSQCVVSRSSRNNTIFLRKLPIHFACQFSAPKEVIMNLLDIYPEGIRAKDERGRLPVHLLFHINTNKLEENEALLDIAKYLLHLYPESLHIPDSRGMLPIHR